MKALSIRQPWASLIIDGPKRLENRPRRTHFRGWCLVHASLTNEDFEAFHFVKSRSEQFAALSLIGDTLRAPLKSGGIIGAMHITDCITASPDPWFIGPFAYVIDRVINLPFYACKGRLGLFDVSLPSEIAAQVPAE